MKKTAKAFSIFLSYPVKMVLKRAGEGECVLMDNMIYFFLKHNASPQASTR